MRFTPYVIPMMLGLTLAFPTVNASAQIAVGIGISAPIAPPPLPVYVQPPIPAPGYLWTPGYWAYGSEYYWVPGTWVRPPSIGVLWTPPYWGFVGGVYGFNAGYWGPHVGFYGGINYGFGYGGIGFGGGFWQGGSFSYNSSVTNIGNTHITNVYNKTVVNNNPTHTSFNGGAAGVQAKPTAEEQAEAHERHIQPTNEQSRHIEAARANPALRASVNHGKPAVAATTKAGEFKGPGVTAATTRGSRLGIHGEGRQAARVPGAAHAPAAANPPGTGRASGAAPEHVMRNRRAPNPAARRVPGANRPAARPAPARGPSN